MKDPKQEGIEAGRAWMQRLVAAVTERDTPALKALFEELKLVHDAAWRDSRAQARCDGWQRALSNWEQVASGGEPSDVITGTAT